MKITAIKTDIINAYSADITKVLSNSFAFVPENCVIAISSKIVALCEGSVIKKDNADKEDIIKKEADFYLPKRDNKYDVILALKNNILIANAGVDESNAEGYYVLWPKNPQESANYCWQFIRDNFKVKNIGIIITDSITTPLKWGVTGTTIAHCGFKGVNNKINSVDLYNQKFNMTKINVSDALAVSAVLCMGETNEQTPLALIEDVPFVEFLQNVPTKEEIKSSLIDINEDLYGQILNSVKWHKGGK